MDTLPLDQKFLHLLIYLFSESGFLGTSLSEQNVITYAKLKGIHHDILVHQYQELEGCTWDQFDEIDKTEFIEQDVEFKFKMLNNYLSSIDKDDQIDESFEISQQDLENKVFSNFYHPSSLTPINQGAISFKKYQNRVLYSFSKKIHDLIEPIIRLDLLKNAQNKRMVESKVYFRKTWDEGVANLYRHLNKKLDTDDLKTIQEYAELNYFIERYQHTTMEEYRRLLYGALKQVKHRKS